MEILEIAAEGDAGDGLDARAVAEAVRGGLIAFNGSIRPDPTAAPVTLAIRGEDGAVVAGLLGRTAYGWLRIDIVWVSEALRGRGVGKVLVARAERLAAERGCHGVHLDTYGFQAPGFYEHLGYREFGQLERYPDQDLHRFYRKSLA